MAASSERHKQQIRELVDIFNAGDGVRYLAAYADDAAIHGLPAGLEPSKEGLSQFIGVVAGAFPDITFTVEDLLGDGDRVAFRGTYKATHSGDFMGVPASNRVVEFGGMSVFRYRDDGLIAERWMLLDNVTLLGQVGLTPQPAPQA